MRRRRSAGSAEEAAQSKIRCSTHADVQGRFDLCIRSAWMPVYADNAPERLAATEFLLGILHISAVKTLFLFRTAVVIFLWLICLPVGTSWMRRLFFVRSLNSVFVFRSRLELGALVADWMQGVILSLLVVAVFLIVTALREYLLRNEREDMLQRRQPEADRNQHDDVALQDDHQFEVHPAAIAENVHEPGHRMDHDIGNPGEVVGWDRRGLGDDVNDQEAEDMMLGFFDVREEEVPLDEFVGLRGPLRVMLENALTALISNGLFIGLLTLIPFSLGRVVLWIKHNWQLFFVLPFWLWEEQDEAQAFYSDGVTLLVGYCTLIVSTLTVAVVSLVLGGGGPMIAAHPPLLRQTIAVVRYAAIMCKVGMLLAVELVVLPIACGWWLDLCSLDLVDSKAEHRFSFVASNFFAAHFLHWLVGVVYMLHISVFVAVMREVVRPEVLWFIRNPADADEHPLRDLIDEPLPKHARRIVLSSLLYIPLTFGFIYLPIAIARLVWPSLFPLRGSLHDPFSDVPAYLLLLQISLPIVMEHLRPGDSFKGLLYWWLSGAGHVVGLRDVILPTAVAELTPSHHAESFNADSAAADDDNAACLHEQRGHADRVSLWARVALMVALAWATIAVVGAACIVLPVGAGRGVLALAGGSVSHDVYAFSLGFFLVGAGLELLAKLAAVVLQHGAATVLAWAYDSSLHVCECALAAAILLLAVPSSLGTLLDLTFVVPLRVGLSQSPILGSLGHWLVGMLVLKLGYRAVVQPQQGLVPRWRELLLEAGRQRWRELRVGALLSELCLPLVAASSLLLAAPYSFAFGVLPAFGVAPVVCTEVWRWIFPAAAGLASLWAAWLGLGEALTQLHDSLRDSLYLVGRRLHNFT